MKKKLPVMEMDVGEDFDKIVTNMERLFGRPVNIHKKNAKGEWELEGPSDEIFPMNERNLS